MNNQRRPTRGTTHETNESQSLSDSSSDIDRSATTPVGNVRGRAPGGNNQMLSVTPDAEEIAAALNNYNAKTQQPRNAPLSRRQLSPLAQPDRTQAPETREPQHQVSLRSMLPKVAEALSKQNLHFPKQTPQAPTSRPNPDLPAPHNFQPPTPQAHDTALKPKTRPQASGQKKDRPKENEDKKRRQLEAYFGKRPFLIYLSILTGLGLTFHPGRYDPFYGFQMTLDAPLIVGTTLILLALFWRFFVITIPSDAQIDEWTVDELAALEAQAIEQMELDENELITDPIVFTGYPDITRLNRAFRTSRYGKDHVLRYTPRALTIIAFRKNDILTFEGAVDLTTGSRFYDTVNEFFYRDIATVGTSRQTINRDLKTFSRFVYLLKPWRWAFIDRLNRLISGRYTNSSAQRNSRDIFTLDLINGQRIMTVLRDGRMAGDRDYEELPVTLETEIIPLIRELVRQKKNEQVGPEAKASLSQPNTDQ